MTSKIYKKYSVFELENVRVKWPNKNVFIVMPNNNIKSDMLTPETLTRSCRDQNTSRGFSIISISTKSTVRDVSGWSGHSD